MTTLRQVTSAGRAGVAALLLLAGGFGVIAGRTLAWNQSVGGLTAALGSGLVLFVALIGIVVLTVGAIVIASLASGSARKLRTFGLVVLGVSIGFGLGYSTAAATGGTYRAPVVLERSGTATIALTTTGLDFEPTRGASTTCHSVPDGTDVESFSSLDLGELGVDGAAGTLRGNVGVVVANEPGVAVVSLWIDGGDLPEGAFQPFWEGRVSAGGTGAATGTVAFTTLPLSESPDPSLDVGPWPAALAGSIEWSCGAF